MRVLICGSRDWNANLPIMAVLEGLLQPDGTTMLTVIEGGARGADAVAAEWVRTVPSEFVQHEQYPADWDVHGKAAGPIRNQRMLDKGKPDQVWAFVTKPLEDSRGTADMVRRARAAGITTYVVQGGF